MRREIDLKEISDGRLYTENDLVKAGCGDCQGCSACCRGMGTSIVLDPLDIFRLTTQLEMTFEQLLQKYAELNVVDGVILPNDRSGGSMCFSQCRGEMFHSSASSGHLSSVPAWKIL